VSAGGIGARCRESAQRFGGGENKTAPATLNPGGYRNSGAVPFEGENGGKALERPAELISDGRTSPGPSRGGFGRSEGTA
jgi:hypothetical protein